MAKKARVKGPPIIRVYECGHREFTGTSFTRRPENGMETLMTTPLGCVGMCTQCRVNLCDHPKRQWRGMSAPDLIDSVSDGWQLESEDPQIDRVTLLEMEMFDEDEIAQILYNIYHDTMETSSRKRGQNVNWTRTPWADLVQKYPHMADGWRKLAAEYAMGASKI